MPKGKWFALDSHFFLFLQSGAQMGHQHSYNPADVENSLEGGGAKKGI